MFIKYNAMRYAYVLIIITCIVTFTHAEFAGAARKTQAKRHFLWSVEKGGNTVYLLGSLHILKQDSYPLPEAITTAYNCCNKMVFETDLDGMSGPEVQAKMMKLGLYPRGQTLSKNMSPQTYEKVKKKLAGTGLSIGHFEQFKPWFIALTLATMEIQRLGFDPRLGIDRYFYNKAKEDGKAMVFLETNEFQINLMATLSRRNQEMFLGETLKELEIIETMASDMVRAWQEGDNDKLYSIIRMGYDEYPDIYNRFFVQRNRKWVPKIERLLRTEGNALIIVGAGHLVGNDSVIELLRKKRYKVTQH